MDDPTEAELSSSQVEAVRARREALHDAVARFEAALDAATVAGAPEADVFRVAVAELVAAIREHVRGAEAHDGPLAQILDAAPWLATRARRLRHEHDALLDRGEELLDRTGDHVPAAAVEEARGLAARVLAHRHHAAALLTDAYNLDLSAGD